MKIVHLVPAMQQGGVESVVCSLARELTAAGDEVVVVSRGGRLAQEIVTLGARHVTMDLKSKNPLTAFSRARQLRKLLKRENPDLVCAHSRVPAWLFVLANRTLGLKWITYAQGANSVSRYSEVMTKGDLVITPSQYLTDYLTAHYPVSSEKIRIVSPAIDTDAFDSARVNPEEVAELRRAWGIEPGDYVVMSVGRLTPLKGHEGLIDAVPPDMKLVIVGSADKMHEGYAAALRAKAGKNVVFAGFQKEIPPCLAVADLVVSANVTKAETFGLTIAEALSMDKPVVARAFGGAKEIIRDGETGLLIEGTDFGAAIRAARGQKFHGMRESIVTRYTRELLLKRTQSAYREVVDGQ